MQFYLINSSVCLFSLWLVYKLLLENTSWHRFKRFYLLAIVVVSAVIPLIIVKTTVVPVSLDNVLPVFQMDAPNNVTYEDVMVESSFDLDWSYLILIIYCLGAVLMFLRLVRNLYDLKLRSTDHLIEYDKYFLVVRDNVKIPHSFFNRIFVSTRDHETGNIPQMLLDHEQAHLDQKHSGDILFIELVMVALWFHPMIYILKYSIKLNHEFMADKAVINKGSKITTYQELLLEYVSGKRQSVIANTFNYPFIKKRFTLMKTTTSFKAGIIRCLAIIPVTVLLTISCGRELTRSEPIVRHYDTPYEDGPDDSYGELIESDEPTGTFEYNGQKFRYEVQPDFNIKVLTMDGQEIDKEKNKFYPYKYYNANQEIEKLLENKAETAAQMAAGKLIVVDYDKKIDFETLKTLKTNNGRASKSTVDGNLLIQIFPSDQESQLKIKEQILKSLGNESPYKSDQNNIQKINLGPVFLRAFKERYADSGAFYVEDKMLAEPQFKDAFTQNKSYGYRVGKNDQNKPSLYASENLPRTENITQLEYSKLFGLKKTDPVTQTFVVTAYDGLNSVAMKDTIVSMKLDDGSNANVALKFEESPYVFYKINGERGKGTLIHNGIEYRYRMPDDYTIEWYRGKTRLSPSIVASLNMVVSPIWNSKKEEKAIKKDAFIKDKFEKGDAVIWFPKGYSENYQEMLDHDFGDTYIIKTLNDEKLRIDLIPYSYKNTNPSFIEFFKRDKI